MQGYMSARRHENVVRTNLLNARNYNFRQIRRGLQLNDQIEVATSNIQWRTSYINDILNSTNALRIELERIQNIQ